MIDMRENSWTILIYANGNNDLEPEIWQAIARVKKVGSMHNVNVVIQLGRAKYQLVKIMRPTCPPQAEETWSGVRRYVIAQGQLNLTANLGAINMADPKRLYEFVKWGMQAYPANRYMLILGGHGYQFVGAMTDYTQKSPYIMGIPEMVRAINMAGKELERKIDILVLDICYFNFIEVIYELGEDESHAVENAITYIYTGPIEGLPYDKIIELVQKNIHINDTAGVIRELVDNLCCELVAVSINHQKLEQLKQLYNELALEQMAGTANIGDGSGELVDNISVKLLSLVIHFKKVSPSDEALIAVYNKPTSDLEKISRYYRLGFAQHNCWTYLLSNKGFDANVDIAEKSGFRPLKLRAQEVYAFISIMNPGLEEDRKKEIIRELFRQRKWK